MGEHETVSEEKGWTTTKPEKDNILERIWGQIKLIEITLLFYMVAGALIVISIFGIIYFQSVIVLGRPPIVSFFVAMMLSSCVAILIFELYKAAMKL